MKMDAETKEYKISSHISGEVLTGHRRTPSGTVKISLSPTEDEKGISF